MVDDGGQGGQWLNVTQAAHRLGWPRERLRSLARRGRLRTQRGNSGELMVLLTPELLARARETHGPAQGLADRSTHGSAPGLGADDPEAGLWAEGEVVALRQQLADLRVELARAQEQATAAQALVETRLAAQEAVAAADVAAAQAREAILRELVDELKAQLAEARRPWWRRWLG